MKKYNEYMDGVTVSDTLHERLKNLEKPKKKPQPWKKYGVAAAALVLAAGLGIWGLSGGRDAVLNNTELGQPEIGTMENTTDIALEPAPSPLTDAQGQQTMGGYEVRVNAGGVDMVAYYMLPYIEYGEVENEMEADIALPVGVTRRDLTDGEVDNILNGEAVIDTHLDWADYELGGYVMLYEDGSLWLMCIYGSKGDTGYEHFSLEVMPGELPPTCCLYVESVANEISGVQVTADGYDGEHASSRRVSFMDRGYGYRFAITGTDQEAITELVSRLVRFILSGVTEFVEIEGEEYRIDDMSLNLSAVPADGMPTTNGTLVKIPETLYDENGNPYTQAYDPSASPTPTEEVSTPAYDPNAGNS